METENWETKEIEAQATKPFEDNGTGGEVSIRVFKGKFPEIVLLEQPSAMDLWNAHEQRIRHSLWADGWEQIQEPRVVMDEKEFSIFVPCKPKAGQVVLEKARTLQDYANLGGSK
jgi:hypothetical protein